MQACYTDHMQDDDKQPSYERLDETNPERNRRSFFDWLRGKEETEEEKLRKKLDEELKEAARKRATDFEEERRTEEQREVAETRKLKKRWRAKLVEKSKQLLESTAERGDEPTSGYEIAKLMVAERIVKLHDILTTEDLRRSEVKSLKIHIDFMGLLSEKLDRPELEVPEEVEELYQTIAASVEETTGETLAKTPENNPEPTPSSEADAAYTAFASSIVQAVRRSLRSEQPASVQSLEQPQTSSPVAEQLLAVVKDTALSSEALQKEIFHTEQVRRLASVAEKAAVIDQYVSQEAKKSFPTPSLMPNEQTTPVAASQERRIEPQTVEKKVKFMSETELVSLASTVEIGAGRLLSDVYKKGELDREGLVKVLEKFRKGQDYRSELASRREKWRRHKESSPEYLAEPSTTQPPTTSSRTNQSTLEKMQRNVEKAKASLASFVLDRPLGKIRNIGRSNNRPPALTPVNDDFHETPPDPDSLTGRLRRQSQVFLLLASVLLVVILLVVVIELSSR